MLAESFVVTLAVAILAISEANGYVLVGIITATFLLVGGIYTARINREVGRLDVTSTRTESLQVGQASLIDDLQVERTELRAEVALLRAEVDELKLNHRETEMALLSCRQREVTAQARETALLSRIAVLEAAL